MPELSAEQLRYRCPLDTFKFKTTEEIDAPFEIIGQERAIKAIQLGLMVPFRGYNILVQGLTGTGKETTVKSILETIQDRSTEIPSDICYVNNFDDADSPIALYLPAGDGLQLRKEMDLLVEYLDRTVPAVLESDEFKERRAQLVEREGSKGREVIKEFEERIKKENFVLVEIRFGPMTKTELAPIVDGKPRPGEELEQMLAEGQIERDEYERVDKIRDGFAEELDDVLKHARDAERQISEALKALVFGFGAEIINPRIQDLKARFPGERTGQFLEHLRHDVLENLDQFVSKPETSEQTGIAALLVTQTDRFVRYSVNLLVDNSGITSPPIVVETHPTYKNLFGTIERSFDRSGQSHTDFTRIKAGSLLKAMGGYLVLSFHEVLSEPGVYQSLKRTLKTGKIDIQGFDPAHLFTASALKPEPIDVEVKVVLIGDAQSYQISTSTTPTSTRPSKSKQISTRSWSAHPNLSSATRASSPAPPGSRSFGHSIVRRQPRSWRRVSASPEAKTSSPLVSVISPTCSAKPIIGRSRKMRTSSRAPYRSHARGACRTPESDRGQNLGNDPRGGHHDRKRWRSGRTGERPFGIRLGGLSLRTSHENHGCGRDRSRRYHQYRARIRSLRTQSQQGHVDTRRLLAPLCANIAETLRPLKLV